VTICALQPGSLVARGAAEEAVARHRSLDLRGQVVHPERDRDRRSVPHPRGKREQELVPLLVRVRVLARLVDLVRLRVDADRRQRRVLVRLGRRVLHARGGGGVGADQ
jgi:hypothetical protein